MTVGVREAQSLAVPLDMPGGSSTPAETGGAPLVSDSYLDALAHIGNVKVAHNAEHIVRFQRLFEEAFPVDNLGVEMKNM